LGAGIVPRACYTDLIDKWIIGDDKVTFEYARKLIRYEGLLVGGSSGLIMYAAVQLAKTLPADKRVLAIMPDGIRNYMTKFLSDKWMIQNGFLHEKETPAVVGKTVKDLNIKPCITCAPDCSIRDVVGLMRKVGVSEIPILKDGVVVGVASSSVINRKLVAGTAQLSDPAQKVVLKPQKILKFDTTLAFAAVCLDDWKFAVVQDGDFIGVVYPIDLSLALSN
jgi:cystathionine beta-synthase